MKDREQKVAGSWHIESASCNGCGRALMDHVAISLGEDGEPPADDAHSRRRLRQGSLRAHRAPERAPMTPSLYTFYIACGLAQLEASLAEEGS